MNDDGHVAGDLTVLIKAKNGGMTKKEAVRQVI